MKRTVLAMLAMASFWASPVWANTTGDAAAGLAAYNRGDFSAALRIWRKLAPNGDVQAQTGLGVLYYNGQGVVPNHGEALHWFSLAAEQGDADAQYNLAVMYAHGLGAAPDSAEARKWLERAAGQGHRQAVLDLADGPEKPTREANRRDRGAEATRQAAYEAGRAAYGRGDYETAMATWQPLAEAGYTVAETGIGVMFDRGLGTKADAAAATKWFRRAAISGDAAARTNLAVMHLQGLGAEKDDVQALTWLRRAADQNHPRAEYLLGLMLMSGQGVEAPDPEEAVRLYRRAALQNVAEAQYNLAVAYDTGVGVSAKNPVTAARWYRKAALGGVAAAHYNLGVLTYNGIGVTADPVAALAWFRMAASFGGGRTADVARQMADRASGELAPAQLGDAALAAFELAEEILGEGSRDMPRDIVLGVQALLVRAGFDPGPVDGVAGPRTMAALAALRQG